MTLLVDASVAVKWVAQEDDSAPALELLKGELIAPEFMYVEVANILWKKVRRGEMDTLQALAGLAFVESAVEVFPTGGLEQRALAIGIELGHPVYDCLYLALAELLETAMVTADARLIARAGPYSRLLRPLT